MFIITKKINVKSLLIITLSIIFIIVIIKTYLSTNKNSSNSITIETSSFAENEIKRTIILDAGHGLPDGGATSTSNPNIIESDLNLKVVLKLEELLKQSGINVILTRSNEYGIYNETADTIRKKKVSDMENRVKLSKNSDAELFVSIHMNTLNNRSVTGFQVFYSDTNSNNNISKICANYIDENLKKNINETNTTKTIKEIKDIYLTKNLNLPLILIECGFLSNENESNLLNSDEYQQKLAWSIYTGLMDYFQSY